jgi:hypothetical protein
MLQKKEEEERRDAVIVRRRRYTDRLLTNTTNDVWILLLLSSRRETIGRTEPASETSQSNIVVAPRTARQFDSTVADAVFLDCGGKFASEIPLSRIEILLYFVSNRMNRRALVL